MLTIYTCKHGWHYADDIWQCISLKDRICVFSQVSVKFVANWHYWCCWACDEELPMSGHNMLHIINPTINSILMQTCLPHAPLVSIVNTSYFLPNKKDCEYGESLVTWILARYCVLTCDIFLLKTSNPIIVKHRSSTWNESTHEMIIMG